MQHSTPISTSTTINSRDLYPIHSCIDEVKISVYVRLLFWQSLNYLLYTNSYSFLLLSFHRLHYSLFFSLQFDHAVTFYITVPCVTLLFDYTCSHQLYRYMCYSFSTSHALTSYMSRLHVFCLSQILPGEFALRPQ